MNKVIILGNGFDLSHGLKTGFTDFVKYIIKKRIDEPDHENEKLFSILNKSFTGVGSDLRSEEIDFEQDFNQLWADIKERAWESSGVIGRAYQSRVWLGRNHSFSGSKDAVGYKNNFLKAILESSNIYDWVDFEKSYYSHLVRYYEDFGNNTFNSDEQKKEILKSRVGKLNREFSEIREEFLVFLDRTLNIESISSISAYSEAFFKEELAKSILPLVQKKLFLTFNYTPTLELYYKNDNSIDVIHIHGELNSLDNPPIFGYGDEMDASYSDIESLDDNLFLEHFKSFQYAKTKNYNKLESYLESADFELSIVGHSCGLSDRVLLNHVFEHPNCKSIKIYHHGGLEGHVNTYMNISRHFSRENKAMQRSRVIGFDPKNACPQAQGDS